MLMRQVNCFLGTLSFHLLFDRLANSLKTKMGQASVLHSFRTLAKEEADTLSTLQTHSLLLVLLRKKLRHGECTQTGSSPFTLSLTSGPDISSQFLLYRMSKWRKGLGSFSAQLPSETSTQAPSDPLYRPTRIFSLEVVPHSLGVCTDTEKHADLARLVAYV